MPYESDLKCVSWNVFNEHTSFKRFEFVICIDRSNEEKTWNGYNVYLCRFICVRPKNEPDLHDAGVHDHVNFSSKIESSMKQLAKNVFESLKYMSWEKTWQKKLLLFNY